MTSPVNDHTVTGQHWPLLGTVIDVRATAIDRRMAVAAERIVCAEIGRLESVFSVYDADSDLRRWGNDPAVVTNEELSSLLCMAHEWQQRSDGAFNVGARPLWNLWSACGRDGRWPRDEELDAVVKAIRLPPYRVDEAGVHQTDDCRRVDLNAIAKGFIVDRAVDAAWRECDLTSLAVSAGGDIRYRGTGAVRVDIEDPRQPCDNAEPLRTIEVRNAAVATSGAARRWFTIGGQRVSQVLDPRSGQPSETTLSVTALAPDAATADVVATILTVLSPEERSPFIEHLNASAAYQACPVGCWIVAPDGSCEVLGETGGETGGATTSADTLAGMSVGRADDRGALTGLSGSVSGPSGPHSTL